MIQLQELVKIGGIFENELGAYLPNYHYNGKSNMEKKLEIKNIKDQNVKHQGIRELFPDF